MEEDSSCTALEHDESAYVMYHKAETESSCLSFDILHDMLGDERINFPHTCYILAGTQTPSPSTNRLLVMKMSNLHKTLKEDKANNDVDEEESSDEDTSEENLPNLDIAPIKHNNCVNRVRLTQHGNKYLAATWSASGVVYIWDVTKTVNLVDEPLTLANYIKTNESPRPIFSFSGHPNEGYSMDWSSLVFGQLLTGDCHKNIFLWVPREDGQWTIDQRPFKGHTASVEDIQWSPNESNVFSSCSVDKSLRIWDIRTAPDKACKLFVENAHSSDINVMNWNKTEPFFVTGDDDGIIKIWDLRQFKDSVALFKYHTGPITSVEWNSMDSSVFAVSSADDSITIWDLGVELDDNERSLDITEDVPPQLLFMHKGQTDIKELHWHSQIPGLIISTAVNGFNVFKTISV